MSQIYCYVHIIHFNHRYYILRYYSFEFEALLLNKNRFFQDLGFIVVIIWIPIGIAFLPLGKTTITLVTL